MSNTSIRRRLLILLIPLLTLCWLGITAMVYFMARHEVVDANQSRLRQLIQAAAQINGDHVLTPWVDDYLNQDHVIIVQNETGKTILSTIPDFPVPNGVQSGYGKVFYDGEKWILWAVEGQRKDFLYIAGLQLDEANEVLADVVTAASLPLAIILILLIATLIYFITVGLKPLSRLSSTLEDRSADNLKPLEQSGQPVELQPILSALNALFSRIAGHLEREHRFIDDAAHEIRTPLTVIKAQSQAIDETKLDEESKSLFRNIINGIDRTSRLASRLLEQAKATQPHNQSQTVINIVPIIQQLLAGSIPLADKKSIEMEYSGPDTALMKIHPDDLESILTNLIGNALHHTPENGKILIQLSQHHEGFQLSIEDSGPGIPSDKREAIFERFHRLQQTKSGPQSSGAGLGLSITKALCQRNGLTIGVKDSKSLAGACFWVNLPASKTDS